MAQPWRRVLWALSLSLLIAAATLLLLYWFVLPPREAATPIAPYTIRAWEGQVAVFEGDQPFPMQVFDTYVSTLPAALQEQLAAGVPAENRDEVSLLLEDYTG